MTTTTITSPSSTRSILSSISSWISPLLSRQQNNSSNDQEEQKEAEKLFARDSKQIVLTEMLNNLQSLTWNRIDVQICSFFSHEKIVAKRLWMSDNGCDVMHHLVEILGGCDNYKSSETHQIITSDTNNEHSTDRINQLKHTMQDQVFEIEQHESTVITGISL